MKGKIIGGGIERYVPPVDKGAEEVVVFDNFLGIRGSL
jgi:hypothetical protein